MSFVVPSLAQMFAVQNGKIKCVKCDSKLVLLELVVVKMSFNGLVFERKQSLTISSMELNAKAMQPQNWSFN